MKKIILSLIATLTLVGCNGGNEVVYTSEYIEDNYDNNNTLQEGMVIDDVNVSDITSITDVDNITVTEDGLFIVCTDGSTCSVTIDNSVDDNSDNSIVSGDTITNILPEDTNSTQG